MFSGSSQVGVHSLDLTPVNSGGMEARVALHPAAETVLVTVRPSVSVELPCDDMMLITTVSGNFPILYHSRMDNVVS